MSTDDRYVRWVKRHARYELNLPRKQHATVKAGDSIECWVDARGPTHVTVGAHIRDNQFLCEIPFPPPLEHVEMLSAAATAFDAGRDMRRRGGSPYENPYRKGSRGHTEWLKGYDKK